MLPDGLTALLERLKAHAESRGLTRGWHVETKLDETKSALRELVLNDKIDSM